MRPLRVGVSACLLGERVRYDGDHRRDRFVAECLGRRFAWVLVCPETEAGFGVPRETLRLVGDAAAPRMLGTQTGRDRTEEMQAWARATAESLEPLGLCGFVLKRGSPSCGPGGVKLYATTEPGEEPCPVAAGLFARALAERYPGLALVDEEMLADRRVAARFLCRVRARWRALERGEIRP
jgi:uncharacterized protein YbbK (DUF523 family)